MRIRSRIWPSHLFDFKEQAPSHNSHYWLIVTLLWTQLNSSFHLPPLSFSSLSLHVKRKVRFLFLVVVLTLHFSLLKSLLSGLAHHSSLLRSFWLTVLAPNIFLILPSFVLSTNVAHIYFLSSFKSLIKLLNKTGWKQSPQTVTSFH